MKRNCDFFSQSHWKHYTKVRLSIRLKLQNHALLIWDPRAPMHQWWYWWLIRCASVYKNVIITSLLILTAIANRYSLFHLLLIESQAHSSLLTFYVSSAFKPMDSPKTCPNWLKTSVILILIFFPYNSGRNDLFVIQYFYR